MLPLFIFQVRNSYLTFDQISDSEFYILLTTTAVLMLIMRIRVKIAVERSKYNV
jgi:hypothetical protein